jgi:hypothetical protein
MPFGNHDHLLFQGAKAQMRIVFPEIIDTFFSKLSFNEIEAIAQVHLWDGLMQVQPNRLFEQGLRDLSLVLVL